MSLVYDENNMLSILNNNLSRENVRNLINLPYKEFIKSSFSKNTSDIFGNNDFMITYDLNNNLELIEIYNSIPFYFFNKCIYKSSFKDILLIIEQNNILYTITEYSIVINGYGIEFYFSDLDDEKDLAIIDSILIYPKNKFNKQGA